MGNTNLSQIAAFTLLFSTTTVSSFGASVLAQDGSIQTKMRLTSLKPKNSAVHLFKLSLSLEGLSNVQQWPAVTTTLRNNSSYNVTYLVPVHKTLAYQVHIERRDPSGDWQVILQEPVYVGSTIPGTNIFERHGSAPDLVTLRPNQQQTDTIYLTGFDMIDLPGDYRITATISLADPSCKGFVGGDNICKIMGDMNQEQKQKQIAMSEQASKQARVIVTSNTLTLRYLGNGLAKIIASQ